MPFLIALLFSTPVWSKTVWQCHISAQLKGRGWYYALYGRDAWSGEGSLYCEGGHAPLYRTISVTYNSRYAGFGADKNSKLNMRMDLITEMDPLELQIRKVVMDLNPGDRVVWDLASALVEARALITTANPNLANPSLQSGNLLIYNSRSTRAW